LEGRKKGKKNWGLASDGDLDASGNRRQEREGDHRKLKGKNEEVDRKPNWSYAGLAAL